MLKHLVIMGKLAQFKEVHKVALPSFDKEVYTHTEVIENEEVMTLRPEEQWTQKLFVNTLKIFGDNWGPPLMEEDWVVLCQALCHPIKEEEWKEMHKKLQETTAHFGEAGWAEGCWSGKSGLEEEMEKTCVFSANVEQERAFTRKSAFA